MEERAATCRVVYYTLRGLYKKYNTLFLRSEGKLRYSHKQLTSNSIQYVFISFNSINICLSLLYFTN